MVQWPFKSFILSLHNFGRFDNVRKASNKEFDFINESTEKGKFGINIHRASTIMDLTEIGSYSAGCQVLPKYTDWVTFIGLCELAVKNGFKNSFTYTLLKEEWL